MRVTVFTIGHGVRPIEELVETLTEAGVQTLDQASVGEPEDHEVPGVAVGDVDALAGDDR